MENAFLNLIEQYGGFEYAIGFRGDEDHFLGGTGNKVWYVIQKPRSAEYWLGELKDGVWTDRHILKKKTAKEEPAAPGSTLAKIAERAYFKQAELEASGRKPAMTEQYGHRLRHYAFSFGARAYRILDEFGVTAGYSNIDDETAGWRLRDVRTGEDVTPPDVF